MSSTSPGAVRPTPYWAFSQTARTRAIDDFRPVAITTGCRARVQWLCKVRYVSGGVHLSNKSHVAPGASVGNSRRIDRAGILDREVRMVHAESLEADLSRNDIMPRDRQNATRGIFHGRAPARELPTQAFAYQDSRPRLALSLDEDRAKASIRDAGSARLPKDGAHSRSLSAATSRSTGRCCEDGGSSTSNLKFKRPGRAYSKAKKTRRRELLGAQGWRQATCVVIRYDGVRAVAGSRKPTRPAI